MLYMDWERSLRQAVLNSIAGALSLVDNVCKFMWGCLPLVRIAFGYYSVCTQAMSEGATCTGPSRVMTMIS